MCENLKFDGFGRMKYHPEFHPCHGLPWSEEDMEYLCKFYEHDGSKSISMALGRPISSIDMKISNLKKQGKYKYYKTLDKYYISKPNKKVRA